MVSTNRWWPSNRFFSVRQRPRVRVHRSGDEAVLFDPATAATFHLNETAFFVWNACAQARSPDDLAGMIVRRFDVNEEAALDDLEQLLASLAEAGLVIGE